MGGDFYNKAVERNREKPWLFSKSCLVTVFKPFCLLWGWRFTAPHFSVVWLLNKDSE